MLADYYIAVVVDFYMFAIWGVSVAKAIWADYCICVYDAVFADFAIIIYSKFVLIAQQDRAVAS